MAISARSNYYPSTPKRSEKSREFNTLAKTRFFDALDRSGGNKSFRQIAAEQRTLSWNSSSMEGTTHRIRFPSYRRTRKLSKRLGAPRKINQKTSRMLVNPVQNPVRTQTLEAQLNFHDIYASVRTTQRSLLKDTNRRRKYKQAYMNKKISGVNRDKRVAYGKEHENKSIAEFWSHIFFTDEAHIDPSAASQGWILREQGTRYDQENTQERGEFSGNKLPFAA
ncbi:hypothetical protein BKA64DRAFT_477306 [Cadophora sp. MPI-SDFR-AT-0126]|nr:hypothetical protein BKA64DRAFT_477306 [Leotiomycetes sp. MPI-SDFR-AT-0126]